MQVRDEQWKQLEAVLPQQGFEKGGRPRASDKRTFEAILWVIANDAKWSHLPSKYGSYVTCWRRFREWQEDGTWERLWLVYVKSLTQKEQLEWTLSFLNGKFVPAKISISNSAQVVDN